MREIDFLPPWYPAIHQRHRWAVFQAWITAILILLIGGFAFSRRLQLRAAREITLQAEAQLNSNRPRLAQIDERLKLEEELRQRDRVAARLGLSVETTRLFKALEDAMTPEMALTNISLETTEQPPATGAGTPGSGMLQPDRRLRVVVDGVAPTGMDAVTLAENLLKVSCFEDVSIQSDQEKVSDGHVMHEFEVTFDMNLNPPDEGNP